MELGGIRWNLEVFANSACGASWAAILLVGILLGQFGRIGRSGRNYEVFGRNFSRLGRNWSELVGISRFLLILLVGLPGQQFCLSAFSWASLVGISTFGWNSRGFCMEFFKAWVELGGIGWNLEVFANSACGEPPEQQFCLWGLLGSKSACRHSPGPV